MDHFKLWLVPLVFSFSFPPSLVTSPQSINLFSRSHLNLLSFPPVSVIALYLLILCYFSPIHTPSTAFF
ncbi:hypothetical protein K457DRAFT_136148 [Linnemannia elongata AG-77]|uniref:Uncharacterized protein n=1 Tax=Linnemannia elongata AG-77 TaxID=1314771 RepID=A0A197K447_9FUNG|nr:hypothetical protein K457DRAFT_136148 [Linnemannia elongata AG-77]